MNYEKATTEELIEYVAEKQMEILRPILHRFAKNCEKTGWVSDGSLPPRLEDSYISVDCVVDCGFGKKYIGYYHFKFDEWRQSNNVQVIESPVIRYCVIPAPPKI